MGMVLWLLACKPDYALKEDPDADAGVAQVVLTPSSLAFDDLPLGASQTLSFELASTGDTTLLLPDTSFEGAPDFTLVEAPPPFMEPNTVWQGAVTFTAGSPDASAVLHLSTNDPAHLDLPLSLSGGVLRPELQIEPDPADFGVVTMGCDRSLPLTLRNVGQEPLEVSSVISLGDPFSLHDLPALPLTLAPGEATTLSATYTPSSEVQQEGQIWVTASDLAGEHFTVQRGQGSYDAWVTDRFRQPDGPWDQTDILFYVDQSGSMTDDHERLTEAFRTFIYALDGYVADYQVMVATADNGCHNEEILRPDTEDQEGKFRRAVRGLSGSWSEAGLTIAQNALAATGPGGCNEGFLRDHSKLTIVLVSDEPEQSRYGWERYTDTLTALAPNASITAIAGDLPSGCATASPGRGYYDAAMATGGLFLSICAVDWVPYLDAIADLSTQGPSDTFPLSQAPTPDTLAVEINGAPQTAGWAFDPTTNAVVFRAGFAPDPLDWVEIRYLPSGACAP